MRRQANGWKTCSSIALEFNLLVLLVVVVVVVVVYRYRTYIGHASNSSISWYTVFHMIVRS